MAILMCPPFDSRLVDAALDTATPELVLSVLRRILSRSGEAQHHAMHLLTTSVDEIYDSADDDSDDEGGDAHPGVEQPEQAAAPDETLMLTGKKRKHDEAEPPAETPPGKRFKRFEVCNQCDGEFDVTSNWREACSWHDGKPTRFASQLDASPPSLTRVSVLDEIQVRDEHFGIWVMYDQSEHGIIRERYGNDERYTRECCERIGTYAEGCRIGPHRTHAEVYARGRHY